MMEEKKLPDLKILTQILLAVITFGWGWIGDNMVIVVGFSATLLVWLFDLLTSLLSKYQISFGKFGKTVIVFIASIILQLLIVHPELPKFPGWDVAMLVTYLGDWFGLIQGVALSAMVIYNMLLAKVLAGASVRVAKAFNKR